MARLRRTCLLVATVAVATMFVASPGAASNIEEQRARLPPAALCRDSVTGTWTAQRFDSRRNQWYLYTLEVAREGASDKLVGSIRTEYWDGNDGDVYPPMCKGQAQHKKVHQDAAGRLDARTIEFGGTNWRPVESLCGPPQGYNPDRFTGTIDDSTQEFQSVNNDGGMAVNAPSVFRRTRCAPDEAPPMPVPAPPPFMAPRRARSCVPD